MRKAEKILHHVIKVFIYPGETHYVAECVDLPVVTQGRTLDETVANLKEAISLHLEDEDLNELGFTSNPGLLISMELEPELHVA